VRRLFHFSEDPNIALFRPHIAPASNEEEPLVWAIDEEHMRSYPRSHRVELSHLSGLPTNKDFGGRRERHMGNAVKFIRSRTVFCPSDGVSVHYPQPTIGQEVADRADHPGLGESRPRS
jgi:hypothetical protein